MALELIEKLLFENKEHWEIRPFHQSGESKNKWLQNDFKCSEYRGITKIIY